MTEAYLKQSKVAAHAFSPDGNQIAVALKNSHVVIFQIGTLEKLSTWNKVHTFKDSSMEVAALAWSSNNRILTGSYDRSALVYRFVDGRWVKDLVICDSSKAILSGDWDQQGQKFAVGTGCYHVFIGYFEQKNNWWNTAKISGIKSSVTSVKFHPSGRVVGICSTDYSFRLVTCVVKGQEQLEKGDSAQFSDVVDFGQILCEIAFQGWVNDLAFSSTGARLAISVQTGLLEEFSIQGSVVEKTNSLKIKCQPLLKLEYVTEDTIVGAGFDRKPALFIGGKFVNLLEKNLLTSALGSASSVSAAKAQFEKKTVAKDTDKTQHTTFITCLKRVSDSLISTSDTNGKINFWQV